MKEVVASDEWRVAHQRTTNETGATEGNAGWECGVEVRKSAQAEACATGRPNPALQPRRKRVVLQQTHHLLAADLETDLNSRSTDGDRYIL